MNPYQRRVVRQTMLWVNGVCRHNGVDDECCPDFSCCRPELFEQDADKRVKLFTGLLRRYSRPPLTRAGVIANSRRARITNDK